MRRQPAAAARGQRTEGWSRLVRDARDRNPLRRPRLYARGRGPRRQRRRLRGQGGRLQGLLHERARPRFPADMGATADLLRRCQVRAREGRRHDYRLSDRSRGVERPHVRDRARPRPLLQGRQFEGLGQDVQRGDPARRSRSLRAPDGRQGLRGGKDQPHQLGRPRRNHGDPRRRLDGRFGRVQRHGALHHGLHRRRARIAVAAAGTGAVARLHVRALRRRAHRPQHQLHPRAQRGPRWQALLRWSAARRGIRW